MKVFEESTVKHNPNFFLAGRGGETNLHKGNFLVRELVLENAPIYASLSPRDRGQKFALKLLEDSLAGFTFVVRLSYFRKNCDNGKIASNKLESVVSEHGSLASLQDLPSTVYVTIGETWCLNIIGAILRQAICRMDLAKVEKKVVHNKTAMQSKQAKVFHRRSSAKRSSSSRLHTLHTRSQRTHVKEHERSHNSLPFRETVTSSDSYPESANTKSSCIVQVNQNKTRLPAHTPISLHEAVSFKTRRVSLCPRSRTNSIRLPPIEAVSLPEVLPLFPRTEDGLPELPERALSSSRTVSVGTIPDETLRNSTTQALPVDPFSIQELSSDPFDLLLEDWDTEKWPQLDFHDLLSL